MRVGTRWLWIPVAFLIMMYASRGFALGREETKDLGEPDYRSTGRIIRPPDVTDAEMARINRIAVVVISTAPELGQIAGDLLAVKLRELKFEVPEGTQFTEAGQKQLTKNETHTQSPDPQDPDTEMPGDKKADLQPEVPSMLKIARGMGLHGIVAGTLIAANRQVSYSGDKPTVINEMVVSTFFFQLFDVQSEKVLLAGILEFPKGEGVIRTVDLTAEALKQDTKK